MPNGNVSGIWFSHWEVKTLKSFLSPVVAGICCIVLFYVIRMYGFNIVTAVPAVTLTSTHLIPGTKSLPILRR